jgi:nucleoside-diphosphate-sugar epimerase
MITPLDRAIIASRVDFTRLRNSRILITGGTGFVGDWLSSVPDYVKPVILNHAQYDAGAWIFEDWDYIIHLANVYPADVIDCARRCKAQVLYASSGAALDEQPKAYALGKLRGEAALLDSGVNVKIARMFAFVGACMPNKFAAINYIMDALSGGPIKIRGLNVTRTYLYAADMAAWMWNILLNGKPGNTYNVGSDKPVTMRELAQIIQRLMGYPPITEELIYTTDERPHYVPDLTKSRNELGVEVWTPFEDALKRTIAHYREEIRE